MSLLIKRAGLYSRVSTRDKGQENENQLRQLREFAAAQGWEVVGEYCDQVSGAKGERPEFRRLFEDASRRKFDVVLFWSLDRLSREGVLETLQHLQRLTGYGVAWRSFTEQYLDSCGIFRDAVLAILAVIAKQERVRIQERVTAGIARARSQGKRLGRRPVVFDRQKALDLSEQGMSHRKIAEELGVKRTTVLRALDEFRRRTA